MSKFAINRQEALKFGASQTIEHFGLWLILTICEMIVMGIRFAGWLFFAGITVLYLFDISPLTILQQPHISTAVAGIGGIKFIEDIFMWISLQTVGVALIVVVMLDVLSGVILMGIVQIGFDLYEKKKTNFKRIFSCVHLAIHHFIASALYKILVIFGALFFIIPGIIAAVRFWFYRHAIVNREAGPIEALRQSGALTEDGTVQMMLFLFLLWILMMVVMSEAFGMFLAVPFAILANVFVYKKLVNK